ncbi:MAG: peptidylprolyl isomerase [Armatimonadetes bacterium]|nr:peptidylprolyl isomerase [Armatimonadota bacterium]
MKGAFTMIVRVLAVFLVLFAPGLSCSPRGEHLVVGSKNFSEQVILGELLAQQIESRTGLKVHRRLNLGGTFICHHDLTGKLPKSYTLFGLVTKGMDVVDRIVAAPRNARDLPDDPVAMTSVTIHDD